MAKGNVDGGESWVERDSNFAKKSANKYSSAMRQLTKLRKSCTAQILLTREKGLQKLPKPGTTDQKASEFLRNQFEEQAAKRVADALELGRSLMIEKVAADILGEQLRPHRDLMAREAFRDKINLEMLQAALAFKITELKKDPGSGRKVRVELYGDRLRVQDGALQFRVAGRNRGFPKAVVTVLRTEEVPSDKVQRIILDDLCSEHDPVND